MKTYSIHLKKTNSWGFTTKMFICLLFLAFTLKDVCAITKKTNLPSSDLTLILTPHIYPNSYNVSCFGYKDGSISLAISGGTAPYQVKWSTGSTDQDIFNLPAGYYKVEVVDHFGNSRVAEITLTEPDPKLEPIITADIWEYGNGYNVSCYQCYNGIIELSVTGGSGLYIYQWDDGPTTADRIGLSGGMYNVHIIDASTCGENQEYVRTYELSEPERSDWTLTGNSGSNPAIQFIGTTDNQDLVIKTNNNERLRINANGNVGIGTITPAEKLTVSGNLLVNGKIRTNRITSSDSLLYIGDSSFVYSVPFNRMSADGLGTIKGMGLGTATISKALHSISIGYYARTWGENSVGIGNRVFTDVNALNSIVIGSGPLNNSTFLTNNKANSLMIGFNSTVPTLYVGPANGGNTTGSVGIGTTNPQSKLEVNDFARFTSNSSAGDYISIGHDGANARLSISGIGGLLINYDNGKDVYIGTGTGSNKGNVFVGKSLKVEGDLNVCGLIKSTEINVSLTPCDFVFAKDYKLMSLKEKEIFIKQNKHLPYIESAENIIKNGANVGESISGLIQNTEELILYIIDINKKIEVLEKENFELLEKIHKFEKSKD